MLGGQGIHEKYNRIDNIELGSERSFGPVFAIIFVLIGLYTLIEGDSLRLWEPYFSLR